eukprot:COSAG02_NODE_21526_length_784_cov_1.675912_2_plen_95_part_00
MVCVAPVLVLYRGGEALSVCFNTVALLFVCHIDRLVYYNMLPEHQKIRANEDRVVLGVKEEQALSVAKRTHVMVLTVMIPTVHCGLWQAQSGAD